LFRIRRNIISKFTHELLKKNEKLSQYEPRQKVKRFALAAQYKALTQSFGEAGENFTYSLDIMDVTQF